VPFNHNDHYHPLLLRQVPAGATRALDVGCGTGRFARRLAGHGLTVDAIDADPAVIEAATAIPAPNVRFRHADITTEPLPFRRYDFISCLSSIHHVPFDTVARLRDALAPGGVLAVLGCYREQWPADAPVVLAAIPANAAARLTVATLERTGLRTAPGTVRAPVRNPAMTLTEVVRAAAGLLPGCTVRRLLFWRYLLVYTSPVG
jgi:SAM-dependent methyltransferase